MNEDLIKRFFLELGGVLGENEIAHKDTKIWNDAIRCAAIAKAMCEEQKQACIAALKDDIEYLKLLHKNDESKKYKLFNEDLRLHIGNLINKLRGTKNVCGEITKG